MKSCFLPGAAKSTAAALLLLCALAGAAFFSGCGGGAKGSAGRGITAGEHFYLPDLPGLAPGSEAWRAEPPFTEAEAGRFARDMQLIAAMNGADTESYLLRDRGWTRERLRYMDVRIARMITAINDGNPESLAASGEFPSPPAREEIQAVQKYYPVFNSMLKARLGSGS